MMWQIGFPPRLACFTLIPLVRTVCITVKAGGRLFHQPASVNIQ